MTYSGTMDTISRVISAAGVAVIVLGLIISSVNYLVRSYNHWRRTSSLVSSRRSSPQAGPVQARPPASANPFKQYRQSLGRSILLGLEFLIAGDIVRTVAVSPTFAALGTLAILVVIRSFLSWSLSMEIEGRWPWQQEKKQVGGETGGGAGRAAVGGGETGGGAGRAAAGGCEPATVAADPSRVADLGDGI